MLPVSRVAARIALTNQLAARALATTCTAMKDIKVETAKPQLSETEEKTKEAREQMMNTFYDDMHDEKRRLRMEAKPRRVKGDLHLVDETKMDPKEFIPKVEDMVNHFYDDIHDEARRQKMESMPKKEKKPRKKIVLMDSEKDDAEKFVPQAERMINTYFDDQHDAQKQVEEDLKFKAEKLDASWNKLKEDINKESQVPQDMEDEVTEKLKKASATATVVVLDYDQHHDFDRMLRKNGGHRTYERIVPRLICLTATGATFRALKLARKYLEDVLDALVATHDLFLLCQF